MRSFNLEKVNYLNIQKKMNMDYDTKLWNEYTGDNVDNKHPEISTFIYNICSALGAKKILEAGCNVGNNLISFPKKIDVHGVDVNSQAIEIAKKKIS
jgi:2-polyprenyl-3-methyl-5-hydroxy-6-metoxy-1,4-benzoquinol methylase